MTSAPPLGVVLAGGHSSRMGRDKATMKIAGERLVDRAVRLLSTAGLDVVVADGGQRLVPTYPAVADGTGEGPIAALLGAAAANPGRALLALACDLPCVPVELLAALASWPESADWVVPRVAGRLEPLCARYGARALQGLARRAADGHYSLHELDDDVALCVEYLERQAIERFGPPESLFRNLNTPDDLDSARGEISRL
jgi:molybdopterin-guanine dinucleotide biosynthesis protein A